MGFHSFTKPADLIVLRPPVRTGIYADGDLVSGNVRFNLEYQGSTVYSTFTAPDGTNMATLLTDRGVRVGNAFDRWDAGTGDWFVQSNKGYTVGNYFSTMATEAVAAADVDISVDVSATVNAGLIVRRNQSANVDYLYVTLDIGVGRVVAVESVGFIGTTKLTGTTVIAPGTTYTLRVTAVGTTITVYLNGNVEGSFTSTVNSTTATGMKHSLLAINDTNARFDNYLIARRFLPPSTTATVRNYDGDIVYSAAVTTDVLDIPDSILKQRSNRGPYGWYRVYLTGPDRGDNQWNTSYGDGSFCRIPTVTVPTFAANPSPTTAPIDIGVDEYAHGVMGLGTNRYQLSRGDQFWEVGHTVAENNAVVIASAPVFKARWADNATSLRPRHVLGAFGRGTQGFETSIVTPTVNLLKASITAWEPRNEPQDVAASAFVTNELIPFYNAVKAADPTALVLAPGTVSFQLASTLQWIRDFFTAGGGNYCDALSVHAYNCLNGDLNMARRMLTALKAAMATAGFSKPLYQTEQGYGWQYAGSVMPRYAARWTALMYFVCELYGLPAENNFYWYDRDLGFDEFPMYWVNETGVGPQPVPIRNMQAEIGNRTLTSQFDFGTYGNVLYAGGTWTGGDGSKTIGFMATSYGARDLILDVVGATTLTCVDPWGNTFTLDVVAGRITFPISELPQWIRCPVGVNVIPAALGLTTNLALASTATSDGTVGAGWGPASWDDITAVNDDLQQNTYDGDSLTIYKIVAPTFPLTVTLTWGAPVAMNRVIVHSNAPWQANGPILAFTVDTWDGASWTTRYTKTAPAVKSFPFTSGAARCKYETFFDEQWVFDAAFATVSASKVRVVITDACYPQGEVAGVNDSLWGAWQPGGVTPKQVQLREIQVFNAPVAAPAQLAPILRNPAMGGVI